MVTTELMLVSLIGLYFKKDNIWSAPLGPESANLGLSSASLALWVSWRTCCGCSTWYKLVSQSQSKGKKRQLEIVPIKEFFSALSIGPIHLPVQAKPNENLSLLQSVSKCPRWPLSLVYCQQTFSNRSKLFCGVWSVACYKLLEFVNMTQAF